GSSLNMSDQVKQCILVVCTGSREVSSATEIVGSSSAPQSINIVQQLLAERLSNLVDEVVEVNLTGQNTVQFLINTHNLEGSGNRGLADPAQSLTTNTLSTVSSIGN